MLLLVSFGVIFAIVLLYVLGLSLPGYHEITREEKFAQAPAEIWPLIAGDQSWRPDVARYEFIPSENGHRRWREYDTHGKSITLEAIEEMPDKELAVKIADKNLPFSGTWTFLLVPAGSGTIVSITEKGEIRSPVLRVAARFIFGEEGPIEGYLHALKTKMGD